MWIPVRMSALPFMSGKTVMLCFLHGLPGATHLRTDPPTRQACLSVRVVVRVVVRGDKNKESDRKERVREEKEKSDVS